MSDFTDADFLRVITMLVCVGMVVVNGYCLWKGEGRRRPAPCVFEVAWAINTLIFYIGYYMTDRWAAAPEWRHVVGFWVASIWMQGAASVLILRVARVLWIRRKQ